MNQVVPGFTLYLDFITKTEEDKLIQEIDSQVWIVDYSRRLQYYGYRNELEKPYDLVNFPVPFPLLIRKMSEELVKKRILEKVPDQVIINEYYPGQGIIPHKDRNYYENQICGVNLGSDCIIRFIKDKEKEVVDVPVPRRSLYIMQDEARYKYKHAIPARKKDVINGEVSHRERRISITYRKVKPDKVKPLNKNGKVAEMLSKYFNIKA